jgi:hypothetical protein
MAVSNISGRTARKNLDGYCEPAAEDTSIGRTGVNITSGI